MRRSRLSCRLFQGVAAIVNAGAIDEAQGAARRSTAGESNPERQRRY
jgi:hypothetical protein